MSNDPLTVKHSFVCAGERDFCIVPANVYTFALSVMHYTSDLQVIPDANPQEPPTSLREPSTSDEQVFILSLTEVLPALAEGAGPVTDPLPPPATSGLLSEPIR